MMKKTIKNRKESRKYKKKVGALSRLIGGTAPIKFFGNYLPQIHRFFSAKIFKLIIKMVILALGLLFLLYNLTSLPLSNKNTLNKQENKEELRKKQEIERKITFWEKEIITKSDFRDAFLNLAVLNFQMNRPLTAKEYWEMAKEIDPNNEMVEKVGKIVK